MTVVKSYKHFGLTIIKHAGWHITLRSATYSPHQPMGHFHQDWLAVTVSVDGFPIFVDPGTYVYTSNIAERNHLRSIASHTTFWTHFSSNLSHPFILPRTPHTSTVTITETKDLITLYDYHNEFSVQGLIAHRQLIFEKNKQELVITDWWTGITRRILTHWAFHGAQQTTGITRFTSDTHLRNEKDIFCQNYGKKVTTHQLISSQELTPGEQIRHTLSRI